jgi:membrane-bound serine protease (ClpP class)
MPLAVAALSHPAAGYCLVVIAIAGLVYARGARAAFVPGFAGVAAALLAVLAYLHEPPSAAGLLALAVGVALMNVEFVLPTFGCAGAGGVATALWGSWRLLEHCAPVEIPLSWRIALTLGGTGLLLAAVGRAWRLRTLPP